MILQNIGGNQTTIYSWPPSADPLDPDTTAPSFLRLSGSLPGPTQEATWETQNVSSLADYSNASSIARFPSFQFSLHKVLPIETLKRSPSYPTKVSVLVAVIEVEGPDTIHLKRGIDTGTEVSILKLVLGDEDGSICKLTAWRDVAETWGGSGDAPGLKRGDVVYIENLRAACDPGSSVVLTASPYNKPVLEICYRTMPYTHEDRRFRPDLRLGASDAAVRKVATLVDWFEDMAGLRQA
ncbi:hypothetical protein CONPUDRAFT_147964 [Coniophora puteana RWD-64-598 SS2]|uniref:Nucleic acid-binding protein n=1 Tax=Coniophora puteana (strain RWD-64-598) TaxID=741705 RepID=R7SE29_CONPW|nr:uncharacterized protein CONPUDRAFT_147964 [Coniophora puteana RWD-64-598 SS2]EIW74002.1 hypothetical protein CONPUDRAFT_147964 [Coniophora puteana RWD-64-598 SS2]